MANTNILAGTVKFFNETKGYGFIKSSAGDGKEYFVHANNCIDKIKTGDNVQFSLKENKKGAEAGDVRIDQ